jgi:hypothetical protein
MTSCSRALIASVRRATPRTPASPGWLPVLAWAALAGTGFALIIWTALHL